MLGNLLWKAWETLLCDKGNWVWSKKKTTKKPTRHYCSLTSRIFESVLRVLSFCKLSWKLGHRKKILKSIARISLTLCTRDTDCAHNISIKTAPGLSQHNELNRSAGIPFNVKFLDFHSTKQGLPLVDSWSHGLDWNQMYPDRDTFVSGNIRTLGKTKLTVSLGMWH